MHYLGKGLVLLALAPVAWLLGLFMQGPEEFIAPVVLQCIGLGLAAWGLRTERAGPAVAGFLVAAVGILLFYLGEGLFTNPASFAGGLFLVGCLVCALGAAKVAFPILATGFFVLTAGSVLWVFADAISGGWIWQPGNLLAFGGSVLAGLSARDEP
jgi:hypothetical protein